MIALTNDDRAGLIDLLICLIETGNQLKKSDFDEGVEDCLARVEEFDKRLMVYLDRYRDELQGDLQKKIDKINDMIENYFFFLKEDQDMELLQDTLEILQDLKTDFEELEDNISPLPLRMALSLDEVLKINGLIKYLIDLDSELKGKRAIKGDYHFRMLRNSEDIIKEAISLSVPDCPVDMVKLDIYRNALSVVDNYKSFVKGEKELKEIPSLEKLKEILPSIQEILAGYDKELKLIGLIDYLINTGQQIKDIYENMVEEDAERFKGRIYRFLKDDLKRIAAEKERYDKRYEVEKFALDALELCKEVVENYIKAIEANDPVIITEVQDNIMKAAGFVQKFKLAQQDTSETGLLQYLINTGRDLRDLMGRNMEEDEKEDYFEQILHNLYQALGKIDRKSVV